MKQRRTTDPQVVARQAMFDALNMVADAMGTLNRGNLENTRSLLITARNLVNDALREIPKILRAEKNKRQKT